MARLASQIEAENNAIFILAVPIALELIDKGITAYDAWELQQAIEEGRDEDAKEIAADIAIGLATEAVPGNKILQRVADTLSNVRGGDEIIEGAEEIVQQAGRRGDDIAHNSSNLSDNVPKGSAGAMARREYQGASYHGKVDNAVKSKAPTNGQDALDVSVQVKDTSPRRVGIDYQTGEFTVFDQTSAGVFHGHVRSWNDLTSQMQNALRKAGMVDRKGNILGGGQ